MKVQSNTREVLHKSSMTCQNTLRKSVVYPSLHFLLTCVIRIFNLFTMTYVIKFFNLFTMTYVIKLFNLFTMTYVIVNGGTSLCRGIFRLVQRIPRSFPSLDTFAVTAIAALFAAVMYGDSHAQQRMLESAGEPTWQDQPEHGIPGQMRTARINPGLLSNASISIDIMDEAVEIVRERSERSGKFFTWIGHIRGEEQSSEVILTQTGTRVSGTIRRGTKLYEVSTTRDGTPIIFEVNKQGLPGDIQRYPDEPLEPISPQRARQRIQPTANAPIVVDFMAMYTAQSCQKYRAAGDTDCSGIEARIVSAVAAANTAYSNSNINIQLNLVHTAAVDYSESGDMGLSLSHLQSRSDGYMDAIHGLRDTHGADIVSLITEDSNACGVGYIMRNESTQFAGYAFNVVYSRCLSNQTLAHEIGHNMGSAHDRDNARSGIAVADYAFGYRLCGNNGFTTVMAYYCQGALGRSYFSNPNVRLSDGRATGTATENNARSISEVAGTVASFRQTSNSGSSGGGTGSGGGGSGGGSAAPPAAPASLAGTALSSTRIELRWRDNANNESGFHIDRATGNGAFSRIATVGANVTRVINNGLRESTRYRFRVRAYNGDGASAWSNTISVSTLDTNTENSAPVRPTHLRYRYRASHNILALAWKDNATNEDRYDVFRNNRRIASLSPNSTFYRDTSIRRGRTYVYRVDAINTAGRGRSASVRIRPLARDSFYLSRRMKPLDNGRTAAILTWTGTEASRVDIIRNGRRMARRNNIGRFVFSRPEGNPANYQICEAGTRTCSNTVRVVH